MRETLSHFGKLHTSSLSSMATFSPLPTALSTSSSLNPNRLPSRHRHLSLLPKRTLTLFVTRSTDTEGGAQPEAVAAAAAGATVKAEVPKFRDSRWVNGTWDLKQFVRGGGTDWDAVIDAEVRRRKWLEDYPEETSNDEAVVFDTSIIPWWAWIKRFHLPEAERLNGRAAMVGFFMAYFVDSLTGIGLVNQTGNFFCKTLLFAAVVGVLLIRKNEDIENMKKLLEETVLYDKQWLATWRDDSPSDSKK